MNHYIVGPIIIPRWMSVYKVHKDQTSNNVYSRYFNPSVELDTP